MGQQMNLGEQGALYSLLMQIIAEREYYES